MEAIRQRNNNVVGKTENGTIVYDSGEKNDKDIFLKMLVGQMTNQDPFNTKDPSQYITQLAQFNTLEQMISLNDSMRYLVNLNNAILSNTALGSASVLIGKSVEVSNLDESGKYENCSGKVKSVAIKDGQVFLEVKLDNTGEIKDFEYSSLVKVNDNKEY
ncbi:flagellar hook capping FlgD N-terminal domain-containing protein [Clostridium sp. D53t1_180928_C8]|uniref:flagellar hook capping FlgD N-terminal domain-containing protein n=1 Tax=Clostridium sp. D53t1_180928_C8 TaxID=2787101 RepID=UPI0018A8E659|nr:flagellar hook capping FlgD N-terminal domain-containing protein [Clostridium sp. D53t1_180928_C8]